MTSREGKGSASSSGYSGSTDESGGGVPVDGFLSLVRALIGCGASADVAVQSATTLYASQSHSEPASSGLSGKSCTRAERSKRRQETWQANMSVLPYHSGQCYLHVIRWGRRKGYAEELKASPTFRSFVARLRDGDLDERVAKEMFLYRVSPDAAFGSNVVYHVASECTEGVLISTVYDAIAGFLRLYPWVNKEFVLEGSGVESISLVGSVGRVPVEANVGASGVTVGDSVGSSDDETMVEEPMHAPGELQSGGSGGGVLRFDGGVHEFLDLLSELQSDGSDSGESEGFVYNTCDVFFPLTVAENILGDGSEWVSVSEAGSAPTLGGTLYQVPIGVRVRLSNGLLIWGYTRNVSLLLSSAVSVVEVYPSRRLPEQVLGRACYASLDCCITGGHSGGGVVAQLCRTTLDEEYGSTRCRFGRGVHETRVCGTRRYCGGPGASDLDSLLVGVEQGRVRVGPVFMEPDQRVRCVARGGVVDVAVVSLDASALVSLDGFVNSVRA